MQTNDNEQGPEHITNRAVRGTLSYAVQFLVAVAVGAGVTYAITSARGPQSAVPNQTGSNQAEGTRIAALLPFAADQLIAMGITPTAVPSLRDDIPEAWRGIPTITIDHSAGPNIEQLIVSGADTVIMSATYAQFTKQIEELSNARVVIMDVESLPDVEANIRTLGKLVGAPDKADQVIATLSTQVPDLSDSEDPTSVLAIFGTPHAFYAFLPGSYLGDLVEKSGGQLITQDMNEHPVFKGLAPLSMEVVIDRDPDLLLVIFHGPESSARAMLDRDPLWSRLTAIQNGNVAFLSEDLYAMRPGSELGRAARQIREILSVKATAP